MEAGWDQNTWGAAVRVEWFSCPEKYICLWGICIEEEAPSWVGELLLGSFSLSTWPRELPKAPLFSSTPLPELAQRGMRGNGKEENLGQLRGPLLGWRIRGSNCSSLAHSAPSLASRGPRPSPSQFPGPSPPVEVLWS